MNTAKNERNETLPVGTPGGTTSLDGSVTAANTSAYTRDTVVRIIADRACNCKVGVSATATNTDMCLAEYLPEYFVVPAGARISVYGGKAWITEML